MPPDSGGRLLDIVLAVDPPAGDSAEVKSSSSRAVLAVSSVKGREVVAAEGTSAWPAESTAGCC